MKTVVCPMCGAPAKWENNPDRPFCGEACRTKDLGKWATEAYRVPSEDAADSGAPKKEEE